MLFYHLSKFQVQLHFKTMWHDVPVDSAFDYDSLSAIALPLRSTRSETFRDLKEEDAHPYGFGIPAHAVAELSPEALTIAADADRRFTRLVSKYRLRVGDPTESTIGSVIQPEEKLPALTTLSTTTADVKESSAAEEENEALPPFVKPEPRWMLWTACRV